MRNWAKSCMTASDFLKSIVTVVPGTGRGASAGWDTVHFSRSASDCRTIQSNPAIVKCISPTNPFTTAGFHYKKDHVI